MKRAVLPIALVLVLSAACGDDDTAATLTPSPTASASPATSTPAATGSSQPSPSPTLPGVIPLSRGPAVPFPDDMAFIIETGCYGCDGGPTGLVRLYRDPGGVIRSDHIFNPQEYGGIQLTSGEPITGLVVSADASVIAASICVRGPCGGGGLIQWDADSEIIVLLSSDGGVTWREIFRGGPAIRAEAILADGGVVVRNYLEPLGGLEFRIVPDNTVVPVPPGATGNPPHSIGGKLYWTTPEGGLVASDGATLVSDRSLPSIGWRLIDDPNQRGEAFLTATSRGGSMSYGLETYGILDGTAHLVHQFASDQHIVPGWWSSAKDMAYISISIPPPPEYFGLPIPSLLDLTTGEYRPIVEAFVSEQPPHAPYGRTYVDAVQIGPFARVIGTASCLNVRAAPLTSAAVLECAADGVLLTHTNETQTNGGTSWLRVTTPAGTQGWSATAYLEY